MVSGLNAILNVSNVDKSLEFYKGLGLKARRVEGINDMPAYATVTCGTGTIILFPKDAPGVDEATRRWLEMPPGGGVVLDIGVSNVTKTWEKAQAMRATVDEPLGDMPWGGKGFMLNDPDGYVVHILDRFPGPKPAAKRVKKAAPARSAPKAKKVTRKPVKGRAKKR